MRKLNLTDAEDRRVAALSLLCVKATRKRAWRGNIERLWQMTDRQASAALKIRMINDAERLIRISLAAKQASKAS